MQTLKVFRCKDSGVRYKEVQQKALRIDVQTKVVAPRYEVQMRG